MKNKRKIYGNILCDEYGKPYKMIIVDGRETMEIPVTNSTLKTCKKTAYEIYDVTDLYISLIRGES